MNEAVTYGTTGPTTTEERNLAGQSLATHATRLGLNAQHQWGPLSASLANAHGRQYTVLHARRQLEEGSHRPAVWLRGLAWPTAIGFPFVHGIW